VGSVLGKREHGGYSRNGGLEMSYINQREGGEELSSEVLKGKFSSKKGQPRLK